MTIMTTGTPRRTPHAACARHYRLGIAFPPDLSFFLPLSVVCGNSAIYIALKHGL